MNQFIRVLLISFAAISAFIIEDTYASNSELAELRHSHISKLHR